MILYQAIASIQTVQRRFYLTRQHIGKETQTSHIHTKNRSFLCSHPARRLQEGTITAHRDDIVYIKVVVLEYAGSLHLKMLHLGKKIVEEAFKINFSFLLFQIRKDFLYRSTLLGLIFIAKNCEFQMLLSHLFCYFNYYSYFCKGNNIIRIIQQKR